MSTELKKAREKKGLTQAELAQKAGISIRALRNYEAGKRVPDVYTAQRIANALEKDIKILFPLPNDTTELIKTQEKTAAESESATVRRIPK